MRNNYGSRIRSERSRLKTWNHVLCLSEISCSVFLLDFIHLVLQIVRTCFYTVKTRNSVQDCVLPADCDRGIDFNEPTSKHTVCELYCFLVVAKQDEFI